MLAIVGIAVGVAAILTVPVNFVLSTVLIVIAVVLIGVAGLADRA